jgi:hypothetical protein
MVRLLAVYTVECNDVWFLYVEVGHTLELPTNEFWSYLNILRLATAGFVYAAVLASGQQGHKTHAEFRC